MDFPFFSVIVPIYNIKNYLRQCVESILNQDFNDYELILVDDGSNDGSGLICDEYEKTDNRIKVMHKDNGGLSDARNVGINKASGYYVWFVDGDDYLLEKTAFRVVADIIKSKNGDVVFFSYKKYYENLDQYSESIYEYVPENADIRECIITNAYKALAWNKVIQLSLLKKHSMQFPVGRLGEDLIWCADLLSYANNILLCKNDLMAYRQRSGSITNNKNKQFCMRHIGDTLFLINETVNKYDISTDYSTNNNLIGHYLAYEFSWLLGIVYPYWKQYSKDVKKLSFLLQFNLSLKVAKVNKIEQLFGLWGTSLILNIFITLKKKKVG